MCSLDGPATPHPRPPRLTGACGVGLRPTLPVGAEGSPAPPRVASFLPHGDPGLRLENVSSPAPTSSLTQPRLTLAPSPASGAHFLLAVGQPLQHPPPRPGPGPAGSPGRPSPAVSPAAIGPRRNHPRAAARMLGARSKAGLCGGDTGSGYAGARATCGARGEEAGPGTGQPSGPRALAPAVGSLSPWDSSRSLARPEAPCRRAPSRLRSSALPLAAPSARPRAAPVQARVTVTGWRRLCPGQPTDATPR